MFGRGRRYSESEVASIVDAAVEKALRNQSSTSTTALAGTVENLFAKQLDSFGKNTEAMSNFLGAMADLSVKRAAVALGQRGGRKRAENAAARKQPALPDQWCEVCRDSSCTNNAAIIRHVQEGHDARRRASNVAQSDEAKAKAQREHDEFIRQNGGRAN